MLKRLAPACAFLCLFLAACAGQAAMAPSPPPAPTATAAASATPVPTALPTVTAAPTPASTSPAFAPEPNGQLVDVGGRSLFVRCAGPNGGPTVLLESGLGGDHSSWERVQPALARFARVCSYDRAGLGQSDPAPTPRSASDVSADLRAMLDGAGIPGPYILVAHSFGALDARVFAAANPDDVAGLILVDPVHEEWWSSALAALPPASPDDSPRLQGFRRFLETDVADPARNQERIDIPATIEQVRAAGSLGDRPLIVLTAGIPDLLAPGLPPEIEAQLVELLQRDLPRQLTTLSSDSTQIAVPDSGHDIPRQRPDMVVVAVQAVLASLGN